MLSMGVGGGCNTLRNAGRIHGVSENLKGTKCAGNFPHAPPVERCPVAAGQGSPRISDRNPGTGDQRGCGDRRHTSERQTSWGCPTLLPARLAEFSAIKRGKRNKTITLENLHVFHYRRCLITNIANFKN